MGRKRERCNIELHTINTYYLFAPIFSIAEEGGPTNSTPLDLHSSAKILFSDKNP
jgi:hypothetical protein